MTGSASKSPGATAPATDIALGLASRHSLRAFIAQRVGQDGLAWSAMRRTGWTSAPRI